jgi:hypothetical protein
MTIDLERLAVDADYWDEVAPEGASHFMYSEKFVKWVDGVEWGFYVSSDKAWKKAMCSWSLQRYTDNGNEVVAKPTKPAAQEWDGEGLPPVGWHGQCTWGLKVQWNECVILPGKEIAKHELSGWRVSYIADYREIQFRPIRSQAEREREPVIIAALRAADPPADDEIHPRQYLIDSLNILYDAGMLRMPDEDVAKNARGEPG